MRQECERVENAIWDCLAEGTQLPDEILQHAEACPECSRALEEAGISLKMLKCAAPYPAAPDCRQAVLDRIGGRQRAWWPKLALAAPAVAAVFAGVLLLPMRISYEPAPPRIARVVPPEPVPGTSSPKTEDPSAVTPRTTEEMAAQRFSKSTAPDDERFASVPRSSEGVRREPTVSPHPRRGRQAAAPGAGAPPTNPIADAETLVRQPDTAGRPVEMAKFYGRYGYADWDERGSERLSSLDDSAQEYFARGSHRAGEPTGADAGDVVMAVSVEWSSEPATPDLSYQFTEEDTATGIVTTGSVERFGDTIEIRMESDMGEPDPLERGELSDEDNTAA